MESSEPLRCRDDVTFADAAAARQEHKELFATDDSCLGLDDESAEPVIVDE